MNKQSVVCLALLLGLMGWKVYAQFTMAGLATSCATALLLAVARRSPTRI